VIVKWFVAERGTEEALTLRDSYIRGDLELLSPSLIYYEVTNALRHHPHYRLTETELLDAIKALKGLQILTEPTTEMWLKTFEVSISEKVTIYDAVYIAMSLVFDAKLVTSDERLFEKLSEKTRQRVNLLYGLSY